MVSVYREGRTKGKGSLEVAGRKSRRDRRDRRADESKRVNEGTGSHQLQLSRPQRVVRTEEGKKGRQERELIPSFRKWEPECVADGQQKLSSFPGRTQALAFWSGVASVSSIFLAWLCSQGSRATASRWDGRGRKELTTKMSVLADRSHPWLLISSIYLVLSAYFKCPHTNDLIQSLAQPCDIGRLGFSPSCSSPLYPVDPSRALKLFPP